METPARAPASLPTRFSYDDPRDAVAEAFPYDALPAEQLAFMLNWAVRAPSVLNTQPWLFAIEGHMVRLYADRSRQLRALDPEGRETAISCGVALFFLDVAARHFGYATETYLQPCGENPDVLGVLLLAHRHEPTPEDEALFVAIEARSTDRAAFGSGLLAEGAVDELVKATAGEGVHLHVVTDHKAKGRFAELVALGLLAQDEDPRLRREIRSWLRPDADPRRDGVPDRMHTLWDRHAVLQVPPPRLAEHRRALVADSPALLVLATDTDDTVAWLKTGRALGRLLLSVASESALVSYVNQPVEVGALRREVAALIGESYPQLVLRLGHSGRRERTARRPVRDVLVKPQGQEWNWTMV